jgi:molecular chaperone DnaK
VCIAIIQRNEGQRMADIIGIDLGTTKSALAIWQDGAPHIIPNAEGKNITPSAVAWDASLGEWVVGQRALALSTEDPQAAVYSIKRLMGRRFTDEVVQKHLKKHILYQVTESDERSQALEVVVGDQHLTPQEVSAKILQKLKADAEAYLGREITKAVITVPAYFYDSQRQATRDAGRIAGLEVKRVLNEPTAACLAFGYNRLNEVRKTVAVYDLGGGTFDISILEMGRGPFWVRAINGNTYLGGNDLDWTIVDWILAEIDESQAKKIRADDRSLAQLRSAAEQAKRTLSDANSTDIPISQVDNHRVTLTRSKLDELSQIFIEATLAPCREALRDAHLKPSDIKEILLVGGQTRMPFIHRAVREFFGTEPNASLPPEEIVAMGAAVQAAILMGEATTLKLADVVPLSLGVKTRGGGMDVLIPRNTRVPYARTQSYSTAHENQDTVEVEIYQGEYPMVANNIQLGRFILEGIEPSPAGEPDIQVAFRVDENGILYVTGKEMQTGKEKRITITDSVLLSDEEIDGMVRETREHAEEYDAQRRRIERQEGIHQLIERLKTRLADAQAPLLEATASSIRDALLAYPPDDWDIYLKRLQNLWEQANSQKR